MCCQSYCCQVELANLPRQMVGATAHHAYTCCAGSAVFLRVWDCRVVFRTGRFRGCYQLPPYLDQYGETDVGLRRGNPLYLNSEHYSRLHMMWLQHLIPENVCRILGKMVTHMIIDWQHLWSRCSFQIYSHCEPSRIECRLLSGPKYHLDTNLRNLVELLYCWKLIDLTCYPSQSPKSHAFPSDKIYFKNGNVTSQFVSIEKFRTFFWTNEIF